MPRFAANLTMMFNEWSFLDRFAAAADAGFDAVEFLFPYDFTPDDVAERLLRHKLTPALFNGPPGDWDKGERGFAARPERRARVVLAARMIPRRLERRQSAAAPPCLARLVRRRRRQRQPAAVQPRIAWERGASGTTGNTWTR